MLVFLLTCMFDRIYSAFPTNEFVIITKMDDPKLMFNLDGGTFRLKGIDGKEFKPTDNNIAKIIPAGTGFQIRFKDFSLYKKKGDPGVVGRSFDIEDSGFIFDIRKSVLGGYTFRSRGTCLEVRSKISEAQGSYINGQPCSNKASQSFDIIRAPMVPEEKKEKEVAKEEKPPIINIFVHQDHAKRNRHYHENEYGYEDMYPGISLI